MKKKLLFVAVVLAFMAAGVWGVYYFRHDPPVETKFVQNVKRNDEDTANNESDDEVEDKLAPSTVDVNKPGNYASLKNPRHVYQTFNNCGPATLSMMLSWYGKNVSQKELGDKMRPYQVASGDNDDKTIFTYEFVDWAKEYGMNSVGRVNGDIELLKTFTSNGIPVVVKTWLHPGEDIGHFRIIRGFNEDKQVIIQDDSYEGPNIKYSYYDFLSMWQPFNYSYMIVFPDSERDLVEAIIGTEMDDNVNWSNALERARREREIDPESAYPVFNMSTSYYHLGEYEKSVEEFEKVEVKLPRRMLWYQLEPVRAYQKLGEYDKVIEIADKILGNGNRAYSELYQIKGEIYLERGDGGKAREMFAKALYYNKNFEPAKKALSKLN
jgi:uncharacterized protein YvpB